MRTHIKQMTGTQDGGITDQGGLVGIFKGHYQLPLRITRLNGNRQYPAYPAQFTGQCQLTDKLIFFQCTPGDLSRGSKDSQGNGEVITSTFFREVGRCEIDGDAPCREFELGVQYGPAHTILAFFDGSLGQADNRETGKTVGDMDLDSYQWRIDTSLCPAI